MKNNNLFWVIGVIALLFALTQFKIVATPVQKDYKGNFQEPTSICLNYDCYADKCSPSKNLDLANINFQCHLSKDFCECYVDSYDSFYQGIDNKFSAFTPTGNIYKSNEYMKGYFENTPVTTNVIFIGTRLQKYSNGQIEVFPYDSYGQTHEQVHLFLRHYTLPLDGFYPYLEEGIAHYGAYCYNNPGTAICDNSLGSYYDSELCQPGQCEGQNRDYAIVLRLRQDYNCDWEHCWKGFFSWVIEEKDGKTLSLNDAIKELNKLTNSDVTPLLKEYGVKDQYFLPSFALYQDEIIEEDLKNKDGLFIAEGKVKGG
jgi:hypothetical protein